MPLKLTQRQLERNLAIVAIIGSIVIISLVVYTCVKQVQQPPTTSTVTRTVTTPKPDVFVWIWKIDEAKAVCGGSLQGIVDKCKENGISGLIVCANRGGEWFNDRKEFNRLRQLADKGNLAFFGYGRFLAQDPYAEMLRTIEAIQDGADGFIFDMEVEYETPKGAEKAEAVIANVKRWCESNAPEVVEMLGYSSFGLPSGHPNFPTSTLEESCAFSCPQWYSASWRLSQGWTLEESMAKIRQEFSDPSSLYAPVLQAYGKDSGQESVTPDELRAMLNFSSEMEFTTFVSIFRLELMDEDQWQIIKEFTGADKRQNKARDRLDSRSRLYSIQRRKLKLHKKTVIKYFDIQSRSDNRRCTC